MSLQKWDFDNSVAGTPANMSAIVSVSHDHTSGSITAIRVTNAGSGYAIGDTCILKHATANTPYYFNDINVPPTTGIKITLTSDHFDGDDNNINLVTNNTTRVHVNLDGNVGIGTESPNTILDITGTDAIRLPVGDTGARPTTTDEETHGGYIRYNTSNSQFEGYGPGNNWGSLGGVINVAQNTKIVAEDTPAGTNNQLQFYTAPKVGTLTSCEDLLGRELPDSLISAGTHTDVAVVQHSSSQGHPNGGSGAILTITTVTSTSTAGKVEVTDVTVTTPGSGYVVGDTLATVIGGTWALASAFVLTANDLIFIDGTMAERMIVDANGYVGIGTTTPTSSLHVHKSEDSTLSISSDNGQKSYLRVSELTTPTPGSPNVYGGFIMYDGNVDGTNKFHIGTTDNDDIIQMTMLRDSNYVGIGTTSPQYTLDVSGGVRMSGGVRIGYPGANYNNTFNAGGTGSGEGSGILKITGETEKGYAQLLFGVPNIADGAHKVAIITEGDVGWSRGKLHFCLNNNNDANENTQDATTSHAKMTILDSGNVGIGTSNPQTILDINNNIFFDVSLNSDSTYTNIITGADAYDQNTGNLRLKGGWSADLSQQNYIDINGRRVIGVTGILNTTTDSLLDSVSIFNPYLVGDSPSNTMTCRLVRWDTVTDQPTIPYDTTNAGWDDSYATIFVVSTYGNDGNGNNTHTIGISLVQAGNNPAPALPGSGYAVGDICKVIYSVDTNFYNLTITLTVDNLDPIYDNGNVDLVTNNTTRVHVNEDGNVGIGTDDPEGLLHITSAGDTILKITGDNTNGDDNKHPYLIFQQDGSYNEGGIFLDSGNDLNISACTNGGGDIIFKTGTVSSGTAADTVRNTDITNLTGADTRMTIKSNGDVGIGTDIPSNKLTIKHLVDYNSTQYTGSAQHTMQLRILNGGGLYGSQALEMGILNDGNGVIQASESNVGYNDLLIQPSSGSVGIGTTSPSSSYKLHVNGNVQGVSYNATSDIRHKENVCDLENSLEKINAIRGVNFNFKDDEKKHAGIIAQEVAEIIPEAICKSDNEKWSANYNTLIGYLIESVKSLSKENETIKQENETLKTKVNTLETKLDLIMQHLNL